jgi:hypothetical protein
MPNPRTGRLVLAGTSAIMSTLLVGCGSNSPPIPRADQAAHTMQVQVYKILVAASMINVKITDPAFDRYVTCGNGKAKLTYAVAGTPITYAAARSIATRTVTKEKAAPRDIITDLVKYLPEVGVFSVTRSDNATAQALSPKTHTRLTLHSPGPNRLTIAGETDCLRSDQAIRLR